MLVVTTEPLSVDAACEAVRRPDCGALALFMGTVRNHRDGKEVVAISYTAFREMAEKEFAEIAARALTNWRIGAVHIAHRIGRLRVGDASVVIAVSAPHRKEAFEACRYALEELKKLAPIWKEEFHVDGKEWVSA